MHFYCRIGDSWKSWPNRSFTNAFYWIINDLFVSQLEVEHAFDLQKYKHSRLSMACFEKSCFSINSMALAIRDFFCLACLKLVVSMALFIVYCSVFTHYQTTHLMFICWHIRLFFHKNGSLIGLSYCLDARFIPQSLLFQWHVLLTLAPSSEIVDSSASQSVSQSVRCVDWLSLTQLDTVLLASLLRIATSLAFSTV